MKQKPLFCICGTYGVGKSTIADRLILRNSDKYVVLNSELTNVPFLPGNGGAIHKLWNQLCLDILSQTGRSVIYYQSSYADNHEGLSEDNQELIHFITLFCEEPVLRKRVFDKWGDFGDKKVTGSDMSWLDMAILRNRYFKIYHNEHQFKHMILIDTTDLSIDETTEKVENYISDILTSET